RAHPIRLGGQQSLGLTFFWRPLRADTADGRQRVTQLARGLETSADLRVRGPREPGIKVHRHGSELGRQRAPGAAEQEQRQLAEVVRLERPSPGETLAGDQAQAPEVRTLVDLRATELLRAHVVGRAEDAAGPREPEGGLPLRGMSSLGDAEVE